MKYLLDTNALIFHLADSTRLSRSASEILSSLPVSGDEIAVSVISLMEILYLSEKNRIPVSLHSVLSRIQELENYSIISLTEKIILEAEKIRFYELHDRLILATAQWLGIPIISSDRKFRDIKDVQVIW